MKISVFGNPDLEIDFLPIKILPELRKKFPDFEFVVEDPNELTAPESNNWLIIDTVFGLKKTTLLTLEDLKRKQKSRLSAHSFDLTAHLFWIKKIQPKLRINIAGVPPAMEESEAVEGISRILANLFPKSERRN